MPSKTGLQEAEVGVLGVGVSETDTPIVSSISGGWVLAGLASEHGVVFPEPLSALCQASDKMSVNS